MSRDRTQDLRRNFISDYSSTSSVDTTLDQNRPNPRTNGLRVTPGTSGVPRSSPHSSQILVMSPLAPHQLQQYEMTSVPRYGSQGPASGSTNNGGNNGMASERDFYEKIRMVDDILKQVAIKVREVEKRHSKVLISVSPEETKRLMSQLNQLQDEIDDDLNHARQTLKTLSTHTKQILLPTSTEYKTRNMRVSKLADALMRLAQEYRRIQLACKAKHEQRLEREMRIARPDATKEEIQEWIRSSSVSMGAGGMILGQQSIQLENQQRALQHVFSRHQEIQRIEESIHDLATLFEDMQLLLDMQQLSIDQISTQVDTAHAHVESGGQELTKAIKIRQASRKRLWWISLLIILLLVILAGIFYWKRCPILGVECTSGSPPSNTTNTAPSGNGQRTSPPL